MISEDQIKQLATKYQTNELNVRREYLQHLFLSYFYQQTYASDIYFKGGTALRIIYRSPRFSEDLDFSSRLKGIKELEQVLMEILEAIEREGIAANISEAKKTSGGYLANIEFQAFGKVTLLQLEVSLRAGEKHREITTIAGDFIPSYTIVNLAQDQLVDEKIQALFFRKKPRDFYDLYFILRSNLLPVGKKVILPEILKILKQIDINFEKELKEFLPKTHWMIIKDFKQTLEREIQRFV